MEKYTMFMDWKNQYSENEYTTQSNLQIQCNPYQATNGVLHRARTNNFTICMEIQKTLNSQKFITFKNPISSQVEAEMITTKVELKETEVSEHYDGSL